MILIVEDNADDSFLLVRQLATFDLEDQIQIITDGQEALEFLLQVSPPPYAVFLDLRLPRLGGVDLLQEIRNELRLHALPVIVMTNSIDQADAERCARLGVYAYSTKPLAFELVRKIITYGNSRWTFMPPPIDPHLADVAFSMLYKGT